MHVIYGLFQDGHPRTILYVGSATLDGMPRRFGQHRRGECRTTKKMAERSGIPLSALRMRVICLWTGRSPEWHIMRLCQAFGMARWNGKYVFSSDDGQKGGRISGKMMGPVNGRKNVESGHWARVNANRSRESRAAVGRRNFALHGNPGTPSGSSRGGRAARDRMITDGTYRDRQVAAVRRRNELHGNPHTQEGSRKGAYVANHNRWHLARKLISPTCPHCRTVVSIEDAA